MLETISAFSVVIVIFAIILAILWTILPFAVFGIKDKLNRLIKVNEDINSKLDLVTKLYYGQIHGQKKEPE